MVRKFYFLLPLFILVIGCKFISRSEKKSPRNLFGSLISDDLVISPLDFTRTDGYFYSTFNYPDDDKVWIRALLFYDTFVIQTFLSEYQDLESYEKELLSGEFKLFFENNRNMIMAKYNVKGDSLLVQTTHGGDTYARHVETRVYKIVSEDTIKLIKSYGLKINDHDEKFLFKKFNKKPVSDYWIN